MLQTFLTVKTTEFYQTFDKVGHFMVFVILALFAAMVLFATIKYVKR
ncbi:MAG TPA: hypothetical protein VFS25_17895 [Chitinophaga sp.]|jgi:hypothetical protein|nr:hypothetical protein [Chitinophaga sp.]HEU4554725.1 hypothetical protein [Chitinophaga sp.]